MPTKTSGTLIADLRDATAADLQAISDIFNYYALNSTANFATAPESLEERKMWFSQHATAGLPVLVAELQGRIVGWASLSPYHSRCAYSQSVEPSVYIHAEFIGKGLGKQLLRRLVTLAGARRYHCLVALICSENTGSIELFRTFGFEPSGRLKEVGRKFDRWLDVVLMQKVL